MGLIYEYGYGEYELIYGKEKNTDAHKKENSLAHLSGIASISLLLFCKKPGGATSRIMVRMLVLRAIRPLGP